MARGRFLDKRTATDERLASISLKGNYLYLALTPFADVDGKLSGNVTLVKADTCPLRTEMTERVITKCLQELHDVGLIEWYNAGSKKVLRMCDFSRYQQGLRRDRENQSEFPDPECGEMPADCPQVADTLPAECPQIADTDPAQVQVEVQVQDEVQGQAEVEDKVEAQAKDQDQVQDAGEIGDGDETMMGPSLGSSGPIVETEDSSPGFDPPEFEKLFTH